jgi:hypothetical protein
MSLPRLHRELNIPFWSISKGVFATITIRKKKKKKLVHFGPFLIPYSIRRIKEKKRKKKKVFARRP